MRSRLRLTQPDVPPPKDTVQQAVDSFSENGCLWLENAFSTRLIDKLLKSYQKNYLSLSKKQLRQRDAAVGDRRFMITVNIKGRFNQPQVYANDAVMPILESLLSSTLRVASFGSVVALPGADDQAIHLDHPPLFQNDLPNLPPYALTMVIPLVDLSEQTGSTAIWEGSHRGEGRFDRLRKLMDTPDFSDASIPMAARGDAYLMDYRVIHGGTANRSEMPRPILYIVYSRPWFQDGFNFKSQESVQISEKQLAKVPGRYQSLFR